jgi:hypothetical protein
MWSQKTSQKGAIKKICFFNYKCHFFHFFAFWPFLYSKLIIFFLFIYFDPSYFQSLYFFNNLKCYKNNNLKFYKSSLTINNNRAIYKEFFECLGIGFCSMMIIFLSFWPLYFGAHYFFNFLFLLIFNALYAPIKRFKFCLDTKKHIFLLDLACCECLSVQPLTGLP